MPISMSSASLPVFRTALSNLYHCLVKADANAVARRFDPNVLVTGKILQSTTNGRAAGGHRRQRGARHHLPGGS